MGSYVCKNIQGWFVAVARNKLETCINKCLSNLHFIKLIIWHLIILLSVWESMGTVHFIPT